MGFQNQSSTDAGTEEDAGTDDAARDLGAADSGSVEPPVHPCAAEMPAVDRFLVAGRLPDVSLEGAVVLLAYVEPEARTPMLARFTLTGDPLGDPVSLSTTMTSVVFLTRAGAEHLAVWTADDGSGLALHARPVFADESMGDVVISEPVSGPGLSLAPLPGDEVAVAFVDDRDGADGAWMGVLDGSGAMVRAPVPVSVAPGVRARHASIGAGDGVLGVAMSHSERADPDLYARFFELDLTPRGDSIAIATDDAEDHNAKIVWGGDAWWVIQGRRNADVAGSILAHRLVDGAFTTLTLHTSATDITFDSYVIRRGDAIEALWQVGIRSDPGRNGIAMWHSALTSAPSPRELTARDGLDRIDGALLLSGSTRWMVYQLEGTPPEVHMLTFGCTP